MSVASARAWRVAHPGRRPSWKPQNKREYRATHPLMVEHRNNQLRIRRLERRIAAYDR